VYPIIEKHGNFDYSSITQFNAGIEMPCDFNVRLQDQDLLLRATSQQAKALFIDAIKNNTTINR
jgi:hypothetical protein